MSVLSSLLRLAAPFAVLSVAVSLLTGCSETAVTNTLLPPAEKIRLTDTSINEAVEAFNKGRQADGDAALNRAVVLLTPNIGQEYNDIGFIEAAKRIAARGRPQDAVRLLEPLTKDKDKNDPLLWATLADVARRSGNTQLSDSAERTAQAKAEAVMKTAGTAEPKQSEAIPRARAFQRVGQYYDEYVKDYPRAIQAYREAYNLLPTDPETANDLGYVLANRGTTPAEFEEAVKLTRTAVEKVPDAPGALDSYGWALFKRNDARQHDLDGAQRKLREAVDLAPTVAEIHYHLAVVYEARGLLRDALLEAERAVILQPDYPEAAALQEKLKRAVAALPSPSPSPSPTDAVTASPVPTASASPVPDQK